MTPFERIEGGMIAGVDNHVGDSISITFRDGKTRTVIGYISNNADAEGIDGLQPIRSLWHCQIEKSRLPEGLAAIRYLENRRLDGRYKPSADQQANDGTDFIFDLQKA